MSNHSYRAMLTAKSLHNSLEDIQYHKETRKVLFKHLAEMVSIMASLGSASPAVSTDTIVATTWLSASVDYRSLAIEFIRDRFDSTIASAVVMLSTREISDLGLVGKQIPEENYLRRLSGDSTKWITMIKVVDWLLTAQHMPNPSSNLLNNLQKFKSVDARLAEMIDNLLFSIEEHQNHLCKDDAAFVTLAPNGERILMVTIPVLASSLEKIKTGSSRTYSCGFTPNSTKEGIDQTFETKTAIDHA